MKKYRNFEQPDFSISSLHSIIQDPPAVDDWDSIVTKNSPLISKHDPGFKYHEAKVRYQKLYSYLQTDKHNNKLLLLVLAESLFWLSAYSDALELLKNLKQLLEDDEILQRIIGLLSSIIEHEKLEDEKIFNSQGTISTSFYKTPIAIPQSKPDEGRIRSIGEAWDNLKSKEAEALNQFYRYACVTSNLLEDVFQVEGQSWTRLVRRGFYVNSIEGISLTSKLNLGAKIIQILKNTQESLQSISACLDDTEKFTPEFIKSIHRTILKDDNFDETEQVGTYNIIRLINIGNFRQVACFTNHGESECAEEYVHVTQFCHHSKIEEEMISFCDEGRKILTSDLDPFVQAAWLQWAFLRIHPFEDGNGRVGRIISSIPLNKIDLPPIVVTTADKQEYFNALQVADKMEKGYLDTLVKFLYKSIEKGIT